MTLRSISHLFVSSLSKSVLRAILSSRSFLIIPSRDLCSSQLFSFLGSITPLICHSNFGSGFDTLWSFILSFIDFTLYGFTVLASFYPILSCALHNFHGHNHIVWSFTPVTIQFPLFLLLNSLGQLGIADFSVSIH